MSDEPNWLLCKTSDAVPASTSVTLEREEPKFIPFQLAKVVPSVPTGSEWVHEIKLDGYRLMAVKQSGKLRLFTRNGHDWTDRFGTLAARLAKLSRKDFMIDGEAVVFDAKGRSDFGALQKALTPHSGIEVTFVAFDLLNLDGLNLRSLPLSERLKRLDELLTSDTGSVRRSKVWPSDSGSSLFKEACKLGLEGIISKKLSQRYAPDLREWTKSKCRPRQEFIICGYTPPQSSLPAFGSLVLGTYENGKLVPRGKVGTGFSEQDRIDLLERLKPLKTSRAAFKVEDRDVSWLTPSLIAEIEFAEITREGSIRQGSFVALREDKTPTEVHLDGLQVAAPDKRGAKVAGIVISHPDRQIYPEGITKMEVASYFERTASLMLPFVGNRPLSLLRSPTGINGELFFQKSFTTHQPEGVKTKVLADGTETIWIDDVKGLVSLAQFGVIEVHPWGSRYPATEKPDFLIWDLDPDVTVPWPEVMGAAFLLRDFLAERGLATMVKTSGGKGLHIQMALSPAHEWAVMKEFTKAVSQAVAALNPRRFTTIVSKSKRTGKIFIDYLRNGHGATCVTPWGLRARPGAPVSMPISWSDLPTATPAGFTIHEPPQKPEEWLKFEPQKISKTILGEFGLG